MAVTDPNSDNTNNVVSSGDNSSGDNSSEVNSSVTSSDTPANEEATLSVTPALNREQRRAQSKGKKGTVPGFNPLNATNPRFSSGRPANAPIQNKIPRTGHK